MKTITKVLALLVALSLTIVLLCGLLTSCGREEEESVDETFSKSLVKHPPKKEDLPKPAESFNQFTAVEEAGVSVEVTGQVTAGAETVTFRLTNGRSEPFLYGYMDILLQKKTAGGWETYERIDAVQSIGMSLNAGGTTTGAIRPAQYGVTLQSGAIYRITFANAPEACGEFEVK